MVDGQPLIFPVNYVLDDQIVVVHTDIGPMLSGACPKRMERPRSGYGEGVTDALDYASEHLQTVELSPWAPGPKPRLLRISATMVTGRRFQGAAPAA